MATLGYRIIALNSNSADVDAKTSTELNKLLYHFVHINAKRIKGLSGVTHPPSKILLKMLKRQLGYGGLSTLISF